MTNALVRLWRLAGPPSVRTLPSGPAIWLVNSDSTSKSPRTSSRWDRDLSGYDLIILGWNNCAHHRGSLGFPGGPSLGRPYEAGTGIAAWHGAAAAFRSSLRYHLMLGGDFLAHPAGEGYPYSYEVNVTDRDHPGQPRCQRPSRWPPSSTT